jgi:hypothetical protein
LGFRKIGESITTAYNSGDTVCINTKDGVLTVGSTGASSGTGTSSTVHDTIRLEFDIDAGTIHGFKNNVAMNSGSPIFTSVPSGTWHPFWHTTDTVAYDTYCTIRSGATQARDAPSSGYSPWG